MCECQCVVDVVVVFMGNEDCVEIGDVEIQLVELVFDFFGGKVVVEQYVGGCCVV